MYVFIIHTYKVFTGQKKIKASHYFFCRVVHASRAVWLEASTEHSEDTSAGRLAETDAVLNLSDKGPPLYQGYFHKETFQGCF